MSKMVRVLLDDETERRLGIIAKALDRKEGDLIDSAVSEAINDYWKNFQCGLGALVNTASHADLDNWASDGGRREAVESH
ncbi:hypothetical protein HU675_0038625 [Bradyrhizobium septentrionale]|uniref:hypothetical protein n=1 Tax=Bradyrhizobium septentrionale TaxID=1404411 RepID=UPI0015970F6E|nr:hypothetical protein [Bradyrhizobium septentrionale]UGY23802.1 hypothetical protein HU675_0038625 [Bradyrhizobium septentrionale]